VADPGFDLRGQGRGLKKLRVLGIKTISQRPLGGVRRVRPPPLDPLVLPPAYMNLLLKCAHTIKYIAFTYMQ